MEVPRLESLNGLSLNASIRFVHVSKCGVLDVVKAVKERDLSWGVEKMSKAVYAVLLFGRGYAGPVHADSGLSAIHGEISRVGVAFGLLYVEYADYCVEVAACRSSVRCYGMRP